MSLKISMNHPHFPKDYKFAVDGLGVIPNGGSITLSEEQELDFAAKRGESVKDALRRSEHFAVEGESKLGDNEEVSEDEKLGDNEEVDTPSDSFTERGES